MTYTATLDGQPVVAWGNAACPCQALAIARWLAMSEVLRRLDGERIARLTALGIAPRWRQPTVEW